MKLSISSAAKQAGVSHALLLVIDGLKIGESTSDFVQRCQCQLKELPDLEQYNLGMKSIIKNTTGKNKRTAGDSLRKNFKKNGFRPINNVVDAYNEASIYFGLGIGGHSLNSHDDQIIIDLANESEQIKPLFNDEIVDIEKGQLIYRIGSKPMAWIGSKDVDSDDFKITNETTKCMFVIFGHDHVTEAEVHEVSDRIINNLSESAGMHTDAFQYSVSYVEA